MLSPETNDWNISFSVSSEEVIDDDIVHVVLDAGDYVEGITVAFEFSDGVTELD